MLALICVIARLCQTVFVFFPRIYSGFIQETFRYGLSGCVSEENEPVRIAQIRAGFSTNIR